jgi:type I restriction enzyme R subunit
MRGGVRVIDEAEMEQVNPGVRRKTHFVIVDAVGVTERDKTDSRPLDRQPFVPLAAMLDALALGNREPALLDSLGARLLRLDKRLDGPLAEQVRVAAGGTSLAQIAADLLEALDPDACADAVRAEKGAEHELSEDELREAGEHRAEAAAAPLSGNPDLRELLKRVQTVAEQVIDVVSRDQVLYADPAQQTRDTAGATVASFREYLEQHKAEISALQILYSRPYRQRLTEPMLKELEQTLRLNRGDWTEDRLWEAFATAAPAKVRGRTQAGRFADLVALVRFALDQQALLEPFAVSVSRHFERWLADQAEQGKAYTPDQQAWLARIRDHIAVSVNIVPEDFEYAPFNQEGGLGKAYQLFGDRLPAVLAELNERLVG